MFTIADIDKLILHEKKAKYHDLGWFTLILVVSVLLFIVGRYMGWKDTGYTLGNLFVPLLAPVPFFKWRQRGYVLKALEILREKLSHANPDTKQEIERVLIERLRKMLEG